jgi:acetyl-CoA carboxylase, biotin carboxylase subunit
MAIRRILIANRGEIAARIIRTCRALDIEVVLAVSSVDRDSEPARQVDRVVCIVDRLYARRRDLCDQHEAGASHG